MRSAFMKKLFVIFFLLLATASFASQNAITDTGEEVILYYDGTWKYTNETNEAARRIETNNKTFEKPKASSFKLKSTKNNSIFWVNTDKWTFTKKVDNPAAEYEFQLKGGDLYGMVITEEAIIPAESLVKIALENAREFAPDLKIVKQEYRVVNGKKVIYMIMAGTAEGMKVTYSGYYYSDHSGTTQFLVYSTSNLVEKYNAELIDFLNGFGSR
jgi:hypothetical protein